MTTYLYRAICTEHVDDATTTEPIYWPGSILGRQSGYLSRSGAVYAGQRAGVGFEIARSEPVVFLTREQKLVNEIRQLTAELAEIRAGVA